MKQIRYVGIFPEVEIGATGDIVRRGEAVTVPDHLAGRPPQIRPVEVNGEEQVEHDPGEGLLAQTANWQLVADEPATPTPSRRRAKKEDD